MVAWCVQDPCYHLALGMLQNDHRLRVVGVPTDQHGMMIDELQRLIQQHLPQSLDDSHGASPLSAPAVRHQYRAFLYTIPTYQNPTGVTMPVARRQALVDLAIKNNIAVLADEVYQFLPFEGHAPPLPLAFFDSTGRHVLSINSFAKALAPGIRLGWIHSVCNVLLSGSGSGSGSGSLSLSLSLTY
jgi:2-aminoadipate transaminase